MVDFTKKLKKYLREGGYSFERQGKGDREIGYSSLTTIRCDVDSSIDNVFCKEGKDSWSVENT